MSLLPTNLKRVCSPENDRKPTCTSNVTTAPTHTLSGLDYDIDQKNFPSSLRLPDETKSSIKNTLIVADPNYSKHPSGKFKFSPVLLIYVNFVSILPYLC